MTKIDKNVEDLVKMLHDENPELDSVCRYGTITDKDIYSHRWSGCHAAYIDLGRYRSYNKPNDKTGRFLSKTDEKLLFGVNIFMKNRDFPKVEKNIDKDFIMYLEWLLNHSPWASTFVTKDYNLAFNKNFVVSDMDTPANLMVGGMIATRFTAEHRDRMVVWAELVNRGVDPNIAYLVSLNFICNGDGKVVPRRATHTGFYDCLNPKCNINFVENKPNNLMKNYSVVKKYKNISSCFHKDNDAFETIARYSWDEVIKKKFKSFIGKKVETKNLNPFAASNNPTPNSVGTFDALEDFTKNYYAKEFVYGT